MAGKLEAATDGNGCRVAGVHTQSSGAEARPSLDLSAVRWYSEVTVVHGRTLLSAVAVVLALLLAALSLGSGTAFAHAAHRKRVTPAGAAGEACVVRTLPGSFTDQGEMSGSSTVADVVEVSCEPVYARAHLRISATELYERCDGHLAWYLPYPSSAATDGSGASVQLDNDGNATVALVGGPSCAAGESLVSGHMEAAPYLTATTAFQVLPPQKGAAGLHVAPEIEVEGETYGDIATIVEVSFASEFAGERVAVNASQLFARCRRAPRLVWVTIGEEPGHESPAGEPVVLPEAEETTLRLDDDGNAFALLLGGGSCAAGPSLVEASLENAPYTTYTGTFKIEPPAPGLTG